MITEVQGIVNPITTKLYSSSGSDSANDDDESSFDHDEL